jgi:anti-sigma-K factor RskA
LALAAAGLVVVVMRPSSPPLPAAAPPPVLAATLRTSDGKPMFVATLERGSRGVTVVPVGPIEGSGRVPELWIIPVDGKPRAVGMIDPGRPGLVGPRSPALAMAGPKAVFAVSLEPAGGSRTGAPTGPVIATGAVATL